MAAYAYTHATKMSRPIKIGDSLVIKGGQVTLSNYNSTNAEITQITKAFQTSGIIAVVPEGPTTLGYFVTWTGTSFKAWRALTAAASTEAPNDTNIGVFNYIAIGLK